MSETADAPGAINLRDWLAMWLRPRATVRRVIDEGAGRDVLVLAALAGVASAFDAASALALGDRYATTDLVLMLVLAGAVGGLVGLVLWGWLIATTGRWLGGVATPREARVAVAWGNAPAVWTLPVYAAAIGLVGHELFESSQPRLEALPAIARAHFAVALLHTAMGVWGFVVLVRAVAESHRFSAWKALAAALLAAVPVVAAIAAFVLSDLGPSTVSLRFL